KVSPTPGLAPTYAPLSAETAPGLTRNRSRRARRTIAAASIGGAPGAAFAVERRNGQIMARSPSHSPRRRPESGRNRARAGRQHLHSVVQASGGQDRRPESHSGPDLLQ